MNITQRATVLQIINKKQYLEKEPNDDVMQALSSEASQRVINESGEFRNRVYTPLKTLHTFIKQVMSSDKSCKNAVSGINAERMVSNKKAVSVNTGSYAKARQRLCEGLIHELVKTVGCSEVETSSAWKPYGRALKVFDGTTITLPDTQANNDAYPKHNNKKGNAIGFPQIRLVAVMNLLTGSVVDYALDACKGKGTGEVSLLRSILGCINEGDIVVGDRLFCNFFLIHDLMEKQVDFIVPGNASRRYDFRQGRRVGEKDHIILWKKPRKPEGMSKDTYKQYPKDIPIREYKINGVVYIATFLNASAYPKKELHALYKRRWEMEVHLNSIKTTMSMDTLSCKTPEMARKEIGVHLLAYNIIRKLIAAACIQEEAQPWSVSFKATLQLLNQVTPYLAFLSNKKRNHIFFQMLELIVKNKVGNRPDRVEPRARRLRSSPYPMLRNSRKEEQQKLLMQRQKRMDKNDAA
jgi:hypothetical protein